MRYVDETLTKPLPIVCDACGDPAAPLDDQPIHGAILCSAHIATARIARELYGNERIHALADTGGIL